MEINRKSVWRAMNAYFLQCFLIIAINNVRSIGFEI